MPATIDVTEALALQAVRLFLLSVLPSGIEVVRGQGNGTGEPQGADFVLITPLLRQRLATNIVTTEDIPNNGVKLTVQPTQLTVQADIHGPNAADSAQIVATLWRDEYAADFLAQQMLTGYSLTDSAGNAIYDAQGQPITADMTLNGAPLFAADPRQVPFITGEDTYEYRWTVDLALQINPCITVPQQFAAALVVDAINVDAAYPPA